MVRWYLAGWGRYSHLQARTYASRRLSPISIAKLLETQPVQPQEVSVNGYIGSIRRLKEKKFASVIDGTSLKSLQAILSPEQGKSLTNGSAVRLNGLWTPSTHPKEQSHELHVEQVEILGHCEPETFPLQKQSVPVDYLRTIPHMRTRLPHNAQLLRFRSRAITEVSKYFAQNDFVQMHTPIITSSDCEGAGEVFQVRGNARWESRDSQKPFFRSPKYLTVSGQLHLEALAQSVGKVWTLSPTFRAEKSETARHQSEFYMLEAEVAFEDRLEAIMDMVEGMIRSVTQGLLNSQVGEELIYGRAKHQTEEEVALRSAELFPRWQALLKSEPWPRITYTAAISFLQNAATSTGFEVLPRWGAGLHADHERYLAKTIGKDGPVFITDYPQAIKPFYMLSPSDDSDTVQCFDLILPQVCEIAGGSMREHRHDQLVTSMRRCGMIPPGSGIPKDEDFGALKWYVDLRRWGSVSHGGFGLGFDRLLAYLTGVQNLRDIVTFPRWVGRCDC